MSAIRNCLAPTTSGRHRLADSQQAVADVVLRDTRCLRYARCAMGTRKVIAAAAGSALLHLCLLYVLSKPNTPAKVFGEPPQLEIDFAIVESVAAVTPQTARKIVEGSPVSRQARARTPAATSGIVEPSGLVPDLGETSTVLPSAAADTFADKLWTLRGTAVPTMDPFVNKLEPEDPNTLFRHGAPNVIKNPKSPSPSRLVKGQGDVKMRVDADGRITGFEDPKVKAGIVVGVVGLLPIIGVGARFDLNDVIIRATGKQPYRYEQHRLAESTREDRLCQMAQAYAQDKRQALYNLKEQLQQIWSQRDASLEQRQVLIFDLWDECAEEDRSDSSGAMARATIEAFIRQNMLPGSSTAFTSDRLAMVNRRRTSHRVFAPYQSMNWDAGVEGL